WSSDVCSSDLRLYLLLRLRLHHRVFHGRCTFRTAVRVFLFGCPMHSDMQLCGSLRIQHLSAQAPGLPYGSDLSRTGISYGSGSPSEDQSVTAHRRAGKCVLIFYAGPVQVLLTAMLSCTGAEGFQR